MKKKLTQEDIDTANLNNALIWSRRFAFAGYTTIFELLELVAATSNILDNSSFSIEPANRWYFYYGTGDLDLYIYSVSHANVGFKITNMGPYTIRVYSTENKLHDGTPDQAVISIYAAATKTFYTNGRDHIVTL